jgi:hypothetical protein
MLHLIVGIFVAVAGCLSLNTARAEVIETTVAAGKTLCATARAQTDAEGCEYCTKEVCTDIHCTEKGCTIVTVPAKTQPTHATIPSGSEKAR